MEGADRTADVFAAESDKGGRISDEDRSLNSIVRARSSCRKRITSNQRNCCRPRPADSVVALIIGIRIARMSMDTRAPERLS